MKRENILLNKKKIIENILVYIQVFICVRLVRFYIYIYITNLTNLYNYI